MTLPKIGPKKPVLTVEELRRFANIFDNAGQVFLGIMVVSPLVSGLDKKRIGLIIFGLVFTLTCWFISWKLTKLSAKR